MASPDVLFTNLSICLREKKQLEKRRHTGNYHRGSDQRMEQECVRKGKEKQERK